MLGCLELRILGGDRSGLGLRPLEQRGVAGELGGLERRLAVLTGPDQLSLAAQLEVDLGQLETIPVAGDRPEPWGALGAEQQAQRAVLAAADPAAQLMQLRDPVAVGV